MEKLILENRNLIYSITKYFESYSNKEDLFQAGCVGMIMAYKNYDSSMNVKFTTYAYPYILGEMKKLVREDKGIKINRSIQRLNLKIEKANIILSQKLMREPKIYELSEFLEIPEELIVEALNSTKTIYSIDQPITTDGKDLTLIDMIGQTENLEKEDLILLKDELNKLNPMEKKLINNRYMHDLTQDQTAKALGITQVQVSRHEQKVLTKLKSKLTA